MLWTHGPEWLSSEPDWPKWSPTSALNVVCTDEEIETTTLMVKVPVSTAGVHQVIDINSYSKLTRLRRVTVYVFRFVNNIRKPSQQLKGPLTAAELVLVLD